MSWINKKFNECITKVKCTIDVLSIDMNALYHSVAPKVYEYGDFAPIPRLIKPRKVSVESDDSKRRRFFKAITDEIDRFISILNPTKYVLLCIDGVAPISKQNQQRLRRFRNAQDRNKPFDTNALSPGTELMRDITEYLDYYIKKVVTEKYKNLDFILSSETVPGEGEHKIISFIRKTNFSHCVISPDSDLIMLLLTTQKHDLYVYRDGSIIDIDVLRNSLAKTCFRIDSELDIERCIYDFILILFFVGNDFLPNIPTIEIVNDALDFCFETYRTVMKDYGYITYISDGNIIIDMDALKEYMKALSCFEDELLNKKIKNISSYFRDDILERNITSYNEIDLTKYKHDYYKHKFGDNYDLKNICESYLSGLVWNLNYYYTDLNDWDWSYPHFYGPFLSDIVNYVDTFTFRICKNSKPNDIYKQLLSILPPSSAHLLPGKMGDALSNELHEYSPDTIVIDKSGKRFEWESIVIVPHLDKVLLDKVYQKYLTALKPLDLDKNKPTISLLYKFQDKEYIRTSKYGTYNCKCYTTNTNLC